MEKTLSQVRNKAIYLWILFSETYSYSQLDNNFNKGTNNVLFDHHEPHCKTKHASPQPGVQYIQLALVLLQNLIICVYKNC